MNDYRDLTIKPKDTFNDVLASLNPIQKVVYLQMLAEVTNNADVISALDKVNLSVPEGLTLTVKEVLDSLNPLQNIFVYDSLAAIINKKPNIDSTSKNVLIHYGVLGMKWGIRKEYESRKRDRAAGVSRFGDFVRTSQEQDLIRKTEGIKFTSLDDDIEITNNIQTVLRGEKLDTSRSVYFSVVDSDKKFWKDTVFFPQSSKVNVNDISLKRPIKIAGIESVVKNYVDANKDDAIWERKGLKKELDFYKKTGLISENIRKHVQDESRLQPLTRYKNQQFTNFEKRLKDNGYDGILDPNARDGQVEYAGLLPMSLINRDAIGKIKTTTFVNQRRKYIEDKLYKLLDKTQESKTIIAEEGKQKAKEYQKKWITNELNKYWIDESRSTQELDKWLDYYADYFNVPR